MRTTRSPEAAFEGLMKAARASGRTISVVDARKAIEALAPLAPEERAAVVDKFLGSSKASALSDAAKAVFDEVRILSPGERFTGAIDRALTHGKVRGQITKGEAERALKELAATNDGHDVAAKFLAGPHAKALSPAARAVFDAFVAMGTGGVISKAEASAIVTSMETGLEAEFAGRSSSAGLSSEASQLSTTARDIARGTQGRKLSDAGRKVFEAAFGRKLDGKSGRVAQLVTQIKNDVKAHSTAFTYAPG